jgi:hypothetical protein
VVQRLEHDLKINLKHYAQITAEHFRLAAQGGTESGTPAAHFAAQQDSEQSCPG